MKFPYEDIVNLPHPVSARHAPMSPSGRAAQFSPFDALNGHEAAITETARLTDVRAELDEDEKEKLDKQLRALARLLPGKPLVTMTCFFQDACKCGGSYVTLTDVVKKIDPYRQELVLQTGITIPIGDIYALQGPFDEEQHD